MPYIYSGRVLKAGRAWKDNNGVVHPKTWATSWTAEEMASFGVVWEDPSPQDAPFDSRFYLGRNQDGSLIPKSLVDVPEVDENGDPVLDEDGDQVITLGLKTIWVEKVKDVAWNILKKTDWMVLRFVEDQTPIPAGVATRRANVRTRATQIVQAINACTTLDEFKALFEPTLDQNGDVIAPPVIGDLPEV